MQAQIKGLNFEGQNIYVGIDVHKKSWSVTIMSNHLEHKTFSQPPEVDILHKYLLKNFPGASYYSAYESGFCGYWIHRELLSRQIENIIINAADIPTTGKEKVNKTDKRDSRKIARSLRQSELTGIHVPTRETQEDRSLLRCRYAIRKNLSREKVRIKSLLNFYGIKHPAVFEKKTTHWSKRYLEWLKTIPMEYDSGKDSLCLLIKSVEELRLLMLEVNRKIRQLSRQGSYRENFDLIVTVPGVGLITGMTFLTEIEEINRFSNSDHLAAYVGLIPSCRSSGEKEKNGEITYRSNKLMREMLIESAWTAAAADPALHLAFSNLCKRMEPNKAIIRIARKLLNRICFVLKNKEKYVCCIVKK
jgi:transposase